MKCSYICHEGVLIKTVCAVQGECNLPCREVRSLPQAGRGSRGWPTLRPWGLPWHSSCFPAGWPALSALGSCIGCTWRQALPAWWRLSPWGTCRDDLYQMGLWVKKISAQGLIFLGIYFSIIALISALLIRENLKVSLVQPHLRTCRQGVVNP